MKRSNVAIFLSLLALFAVLGGTAAASKILVVNTPNIADGAVTLPKLGKDVQTEINGTGWLPAGIGGSWDYGLQSQQVNQIGSSEYAVVTLQPIPAHKAITVQWQSPYGGTWFNVTADGGKYDGAIVLRDTIQWLQSDSEASFEVRNTTSTTMYGDQVYIQVVR